MNIKILNLLGSMTVKHFIAKYRLVKRTDTIDMSNPLYICYDDKYIISRNK